MIDNKHYYMDANGNQLEATQANAAANVLKATSEESIEVYADAGFNVLFINWGATAYHVSADNYTTYWDASVVKDIMDWAAERDIKCFVYAGTLYSLSASEESLINPDKANGKTFFATQAALNEYVAKILYGIKDHEAFYGVSLQDEPYYTQFEAMGQVYQAVNAAKAGAFCNMNLNPMSYDSRVMRMFSAKGAAALDAGKTSFTQAELEEAYMDYLEEYYDKVGKYCGYIQYDSYPMLYYGEDETLYYTYLRNGQMVAEFCAEKNMRFGHVYQTYRDVGKEDGSDWGRRKLNEDDIEWQVNFGLAMGVKDHSYYTYYPVLNSSELPDEDYTIVNRKGEPNETYKTIQKLHQNARVTAKALAHFEYRDMQYYTKGTVDSSMRNALSIVENNGKFDEKLENVAISKNGVALVSELYDEEKGWFGYFVMNATNPYGSVATQTVTLTFSGYRNVQIYQDGVVKNVALENGRISLTLAEAAGAFVIPY